MKCRVNGCDNEVDKPDSYCKECEDIMFSERTFCTDRYEIEDMKQEQREENNGN